MTSRSSSLGRLSDEHLVAELLRLARCERDVTAELIAHLAELDARRLYLGQGFASLFVYCTGALRLSEHEAYNRIEAARAARRFPLVLDLLREGSLTLTTVRLLAPQLTLQNHDDLLASASGKSRREVEELLAERFPRPAVPPFVRKLPGARSQVASVRSALGAGPAAAAASVEVGTVAPARVSESPSAAALMLPPTAQTSQLQPTPLPQSTPTPQTPSHRAAVVPLATDQYKITFTAKAETYRKLRHAQDLLRHQIPTETPRRSSTALSRRSFGNWRRRMWPRQTGLARAGARIPYRGTSPPRSGERSGSGTAGVAPSWRRTAGAAGSGASWNSITFVRTVPAAKHRS
jgi:hypothetical protein